MASPFPNDGSFLERFKQQQQNVSSSPVVKSSSNSKGAASGGVAKGSVSNGKLAFSLKQKSKLAVAPVKLGEDEDDEDDADTHRQAKRAKSETGPRSVTPEANDSVPPPPSDGEVKKVADKLALFVAKNGRQFEDITRQKNPGNTPFSFLFDAECAEYKYYQYRVEQEEAALAPEAAASQTPHTGSGTPVQRDRHSSGGHQQRYQTPASALYSGGNDHRRSSYSSGSSREPVQDRNSQQSYANDSVAMMDFYMKKAAQEALRRPPKQSKDEMPPPPGLHPPQSVSQVADTWQPEEPAIPEAARSSYATPSVGVVEDGAAAKKGHHMGDYIPPEELEKFLAKCNDAKAAKAAKATADRAKIQSDNVGHRLLSKMGWKEGEGLGSGRSGIADPVQAGSVKVNNLGVGAEVPGEVTADDDIYEQYKKRMMLGYKFRPNPLNNPRKAYY